MIVSGVKNYLFTLFDASPDIRLNYLVSFVRIFANKNITYLQCHRPSNLLLRERERERERMSGLLREKVECACEECDWWEGGEGGVWQYWLEKT